MNWITVFSIAGIVQGVFSLVLFNARKRRAPIANSIFILVVILTLLARVFFDAGLLYEPKWALYSDSLLFLYGPLLLLVFEMYFNGEVLRNRLIIDYAPASLHIISIVVLSTWNSESYQKFLTSGALNTYFMIVSVAANLHLILYIVLIWFKHFKGRGKSLNQAVVPIFIVITTVMMIWTVGNIRAISTGSVLTNNFFQVIWIVLSVLVYLISYWFFFGTLMFPSKKKQAINVDLNAFERIMVSEQKYLDSEVRLPEVADQIGTNTLFLSQAINRAYSCSFTDYVNKMRVEKFEELVMDEMNSNLTHWAIAQQAGFNSKSAFYRAFRKYRKGTPAKIIKSKAS